MFKRKQKTYYLIHICHNGKLDTIRCETRKEKRKWLFDYFTTGEEKRWAWEKYQAYGTSKYAFEDFVKYFIKQEKGAIYTIPIRKSKVIVIQEKNI